MKQINYAFMINGEKVYWTEKELLEQIFKQLFENETHEELERKYQLSEFELEDIDFTFNSCVFVVKIMNDDILGSIFADITYENKYNNNEEKVTFFVEEIF